MSRPRQFDRDEAMQEALGAFWEHGYSATSVQDLLEEMHLNRGSLYGTFGDKKKLFLAVLDKYYEQRIAVMREMLESPGSAKTALRELLDAVARDCTGDEGRRGCLAAKAALELAPHDRDVANWLKRFHRRNIAMIAGVIERGQKEGDINRRLEPEAAARFILNSIGGLRLSGAMSPTIGEIRQVTELVLKVLDK